ADVVSLTVYRWGPPEEPEAVRRSIRAAAAGQVDAVVFTAAPGAARWLHFAAEQHALDALREQARQGRLLFAGVGPVTAAPLQHQGLEVLTPQHLQALLLQGCRGDRAPLQQQGLEVLTPQRFRLGALVRSLVQHFAQQQDGG